MTTAANSGFNAEMMASNSFMMQSQNEHFIDPFRVTNYEVALQFGKDPYSGYPIPKLPRVLTIPPKTEPVVVNNKLASVPAIRRELPLVDPIGSLASTRRFDDKGSPRMAMQKS